MLHKTNGGPELAEQHIGLESKGVDGVSLGVFDGLLHYYLLLSVLPHNFSNYLNLPLTLELLNQDCQLYAVLHHLGYVVTLPYIIIL